MGIISELDAATNIWQKIFRHFKRYGNKEKQCDDYYYEEYNKKIFVKTNGNGLIVSSCNLKVIDPLKTDGLIRTIDIHDAKLTSCFEPFEKMRATSMEKIFSEYGFWYKSDNDIITDVEEFYEKSDLHKKDDPKFISIRFIVDTTKLEKNRIYKIVYAFSVPGLYPIKDGRFDDSSQDRKSYEDFRSYVSTGHIGHHLRFAAYFESGIEFKEKPSGNLKLSSSVKKNKKNSIKEYNCIFKDNIFYKKYHFEVDNPQDYTEIYLKWNIKNKLSQK